MTKQLPDVNAPTALARARLVALMARKRISQAALARQTGYRQSDVNRFFTGKMKKPTLDFVGDLADALDVSLASLVRR